jgi:RHS repeat-associated protein
VGYTYDNNFRVTGLTVNGANAITLGYDNDNLLTSAGSLTLSRDAQNGRLTGTTLGSLSTTHTYDDSVGTLKGSTATYSSTTLLDFQYTRDTLDRITQVIETVQGTSQTWSYAYDSVGRLDQVRLNTVLVADYTYDGNGNRTGLTTTGGSVTGTADDQDRLLTYGTNSYTYSSNGELTMKVNGTDTTRYTYDVLGNLLQVKLNNDATTIEYLVDGQNRRIGRKVNGVLTQGFLYQGQLAPIAELDGSNNVVSRFIFGSRVNVPEYMVKSGVTYRLLTDHLGSVRLVVNTADGSVVQRIDYDEYGRVTQNTNPGFQPFGFAGGLYDDATKLVRFGARDYDAETGRWTAKDPLGITSGESSRYAYVLNDPISNIDPTGREVFVCYRSYAGSPFVHTYVWVAPEDGSRSFSMGAGSIGDKLVSEVPRANDHPSDTRAECVAVALPCPENEFIKALLDADGNYRDNWQYSFWPGVVPATWNYWVAGYNSNSYTAGLLRAVGAVPPSLPRPALGYNRPIPISSFRP